MDNSHTEIQELKQFIVDLKADRAAQKDKEQRESWTKYTSMSIVFIAVLAAIATQWSGKYSSRVLTNLNNATLSQTQASDQWALYQAASIKEKMYKLAAVDEKMAARKTEIEKALAKYKTQKDECKVKAEKLEGARTKFLEDVTVASKHGSGMGNVVALFQISIALGSICLVTKKKPLWFISTTIATLATLYGAYIIFLL